MGCSRQTVCDTIIFSRKSPWLSSLCRSCSSLRLEVVFSGLRPCEGFPDERKQQNEVEVFPLRLMLYNQRSGSQAETIGCGCKIPVPREWHAYRTFKFFPDGIRLEIEVSVSWTPCPAKVVLVRPPQIASTYGSHVSSAYFRLSHVHDGMRGEKAKGDYPGAAALTIHTRSCLE